MKYAKISLSILSIRKNGSDNNKLPYWLINGNIKSKGIFYDT